MKSFWTAYLGSMAAILCIVVSISDAIPVHNRNRTTRGFKNAALSTARGFGKRTGLEVHQDGRDLPDLPDVDTNETGRQLFGKILRERAETDSYPADWFAEELAANPELTRIVTNRLAEELATNADLARLLTSKIFDQNQDGELTADELSRSY